MGSIPSFANLTADDKIGAELERGSKIEFLDGLPDLRNDPDTPEAPVVRSTVLEALRKLVRAKKIDVVKQRIDGPGIYGERKFILAYFKRERSYIDLQTGSAYRDSDGVCWSSEKVRLDRPKKQDEPAFESTHQALVFAFNETDRGGRGLNILAKMGEVGGGDGSGGPLARAGQAGMVLAEIYRMSLVSQQILTASYLDRGSWCGVCQKGEANQKWIEALEWLAEYLSRTALADAHADIQTRRAIVMRFVSEGRERLSISALAKVCGIDAHTAGRHVSEANRQLKKDRSAAFHRLDEKLKDVGIVGDVSSH